MRRTVARLLTAAVMLVPVAAAVAPPRTAAADSAEPPNIILITTDDQSLADLEHMPYTLELLGGEGVRFTDAISPYPLCCPARATILTGEQAHNHGVLANEPPAGGYQAMRHLNDRSLPVWMSNAGYRTTFAGKYLNEYGMDDPTEVPDGWDDFHATVRHTYDYNNALVNDNGEVVDHTGEYQADMTQRVTEDAIRDGVEHGHPFFIWQSNLAPHGACPLIDNQCTWGPATPAEQDQGTFAGLPLYSESVPSFDERVVVEKPARIRRLPRFNDSLIASWRSLNQANVESLQAVDRNVRDTVELLRSLGQLDNTLIVFASDNGYLIGQHRWRGKTLGYEESVKIPMLMRGPGVPAGEVIDKTVSLVDVAATFADVSGAEPLLTLDGRSLLDVVSGTSNGYDAMAIEAGPALGGVPKDQYLYRGIRTKRYTYMRHPVTGEIELYDRAVDPYELVNVAHRPTHRATRFALQGLLAKLSNCVGAACNNVVADVPDPEPAQGPVHPDELGTMGGAKQIVTVTAPRWGATHGVAVAWQKRDLTWRA
ncbi:MAG TPA: sulfatase, partial [Nocardioidaceae bacterium]|nr:sulfatase [Nocardioidaceae bacterium]